MCRLNLPDTWAACEYGRTVPHMLLTCITAGAAVRATCAQCRVCFCCSCCCCCCWADLVDAVYLCAGGMAHGTRLTADTSRSDPGVLRGIRGCC